MTLPRGFGSGWDEPATDDEKPKRKCKLGNVCYHHRKGCKVHKWTYDHNEAWVVLRAMGIFALIIGTTIFGTVVNHENGEPARQNIEGYNCNQLAGYIADKNSEYEYAQHRYEWLCVNEKIKEFQG